MGWMFSVTRSAQADVSTVAMMRMTRDLQRDQWTTAPWWLVTAQTGEEMMVWCVIMRQKNTHFIVVLKSLRLLCERPTLTLFFSHVNVINVGVRLQRECQPNDVGNRQEGRNCVNQRPEDKNTRNKRGRKEDITAQWILLQYMVFALVFDTLNGNFGNSQPGYYLCLDLSE